MDTAQPGWLTLFATILIFTTIRSGVVIGAVLAWRQWTDFGRRYRIFRLRLRHGQLARELLAALGVLVLDATILSTSYYFGWLPLVRDNAPALVLLHFLLISLWLEVWFYATHRLLHKPALFWIHAQHHVAKVTNPLTSLSFSLLERAILIGGVLAFVWLLSQFTPVDVLSIIATGLVNYGLNVMGHSNVELFPQRYAQSGWHHLLITPTYHALHHARYRGHYGLYTPVLDRLFGTTFDDYAAVFARTSSGHALERLNERIAPAHSAEQAAQNQCS